MGKKEKKPPLTPEEKKKLKEEKKLAKKLRIAEKKRQQKRDRLQREITYAHTNREILEQKWRDTQMQIMGPQLQLEFQIAVNKAEQILDLKDYEISLLLDDLDEADELYNENFRGHMQNIKKIFDYFQVILNDLKKEYETSYSNLVLQAMHEKCKIQQQFDREDDHLNLMIFRLAEERKSMCTSLQSDYTAKIKLEQKTVENEIEIMSEKKHKTFMDIWNACNNLVQQYQKEMKEQEKEFAELDKQNSFFNNIIKKQTNQIINMHNRIFKLKEEQQAEKEQVDLLIECKKNERDFFKDVYERLRAIYEDDINLDKKQITHLVTHSNNILKGLSDMETRCGKVVRHYSFVKKYETQQEKYTPFPKQMPKTSHTEHELHGFWMKCGQCDASRHIILEEYYHLKQENATFKKMLANYCSGLPYDCHELQEKTLNFINNNVC